MKNPGKVERQKAIAQILDKNSIESQEELLQLLSDKGFELTRATLSRDFWEMKVAKTPDALLQLFLSSAGNYGNRRRRRYRAYRS